MIEKALIILDELIKEEKIRKSILFEKIKVGKWQFNSILKQMKKDDLINTDGISIYLKNTLQTALIKHLAKQYDIKKLLNYSNELVLPYIKTGFDIGDIIEKTELSRATVYRAIATFEELGLIKKTYVVNEDSVQLLSFINNKLNDSQ